MKVLKIILEVYSGIIAFAIGVVTYKLRKMQTSFLRGMLSDKRPEIGFDKIYVTQRWQEIKKKLDAGGPEELKLSIIEADSLLDNILFERGYKGETFEERLAHARFEKVKGIERLLKAHNFRKKISRERYRVRPDEAGKYLKIYEDILREWDLLE